MHNLRINLAVHRLPSDSMVLAVENIFSPCFLASFLSFCLHLHSAIPRCLYIMSKRIQYSKIYRTIPYSWCWPWLFKFHSLFVVVVRISPSLFYLQNFAYYFFSFLCGDSVLLHAVLRGDAAGHRDGADVPALYWRLLQGQGPPVDRGGSHRLRSVRRRCSSK